MAEAARLDYFILRGVQRDGTSVNQPEAMRQRCAGFDAALALPPSESR